jgi:hypothetical protein
VLLLPLVFGMLSLLAAVVCYTYHKIKKTPDMEKGYFQMRGAKSGAIMMGLGYFSIVVSVVQMLGCTSRDKIDGSRYLNVYPC